MSEWRQDGANRVICDDRNELHWRGGPCEVEEIEAVLRLAAAAPKMLAALKAILAAWKSVPEDVSVPDEINEPSEAWNMVHAAIAEAESPVPDIFEDIS